MTEERRIATGQIETDVLKACEPTLSSLGYDCVHLEYLGPRSGGGRGVLRVYIDWPKSDGAAKTGVTVNDCAKASRQLGVVLDVEDVVPGAYTLEVSSPGLDRPLGRLSDFERFAGQDAVIKTTEAIDGRRNWAGALTGVEDGDVLLDVDGEPVRIPCDAIRKANLKYSFEKAEVR